MSIRSNQSINLPQIFIGDLEQNKTYYQIENYKIFSYKFLKFEAITKKKYFNPGYTELYEQKLLNDIIKPYYEHKDKSKFFEDFKIFLETYNELETFRLIFKDGKSKIRKSFKPYYDFCTTEQEANERLCYEINQILQQNELTPKQFVDNVNAYRMRYADLVIQNKL